MIKIKHFLVGVLCILLLFAGLVWLSRDFWKEQARAYTRGSVELAAEKYGWLLPDVDSVELSALGRGEASVTNGFPERVGNIQYYPILSQKTIAGGDAKEFRHRWRAMTFNWGLSGLCHEPA